MKRSTLILGGTVVFVMLVIVAHYVALFAMQRAGAYNSRKPVYDEEKNLVVYPPGVKTVSVTGFETVQLIMSDTFHFEYERSLYANEYVKWYAREDSFVFKGDTMIIDTSSKGEIDTTWDRTDNTLIIYVTGNENVIFHKSDIKLRPSAKPVNIAMVLYASSFFAPYDYQDTTNSGNYTIERLTAACIASSISLRQDWSIKNMDITLDDYSSLLDNEGNYDNAPSRIESGVIQYDESSGVSLTGTNLARVKLKFKEGSVPIHERKIKYQPDIRAD
jgi:hypothetical protein